MRSAGVSIDCLVDGLMVGLTYKVSLSAFKTLVAVPAGWGVKLRCAQASMRAGLIMAFASSIESCFLGLSLSSSVYNITS
eukprot:406523-Rhodomonas_salina.2